MIAHVVSNHAKFYLHVFVNVVKNWWGTGLTEIRLFKIILFTNFYLVLHHYVAGLLYLLRTATVCVPIAYLSMPHTKKSPPMRSVAKCAIIPSQRLPRFHISRTWPYVEMGTRKSSRK